MNAKAAPRPVWRRLLRLAVKVGAVLIVLSLITGWLLQPQRAGRYLLHLAGDSLGLEINAGAIDYRLRGTPQLVLNDVVATRHGDAPLLAARRIFVSLPWRTLRTRGDDLKVTRVELDAPRLNLPALQRWLATRPPSGPIRIPVLSDGLRVRDGRIDNDDWRIDGLSIDLPSLHPSQPMRMRVRGRYVDAPLSIPADLAITVANPNDMLAGVATDVSGAGTLSLIDTGGWRIPAQVLLAGPLRIGKDSALMKPARLGIAARYESGKTSLPFQLGLHGPMAFNNATWRFVPVTIVLMGEGTIPSAQARGSLSVGRSLGLHLDGSLAGWPKDWPTLPRPLSAAKTALPFSLDYKGGVAFTDTASLSLRRDTTTLATQFRLPDVLTWLDAGNASSPLPPLTGKLSTPRVDLDGATLEGVEIELGGE